MYLVYSVINNQTIKIFFYKTTQSTFFSIDFQRESQRPDFSGVGVAAGSLMLISLSSTVCTSKLFWLCLCFSLRQIKLSLGKERQCQPLTTQIIPAHLAAVAAAAAAAINNSFSHRTNHATNHHHHTPALFQTQTLPAALLRPAPGPVRTSHPQVLFAPYWPAWPPGGSAPPPVKDQNHELHPAQAKESRQHLCSFLCIRDTEHPHTVIGPLPRLSAPRMEYPASKDKPDCGEAPGSLTIDFFLYSHRNPELQHTCFLCHTAARGSHPDAGLGPTSYRNNV